MKKKKVHLICNAHLDPIWQWDWQEGASAAISTFQSAVNLAEEFDYIFCHNEVTLYKYIEEYAPQLFVKIQQLVREGKWHIMGGWYLQPDCTMPSGESFVRQILMGQRYFKEKFGVVPTTAINFDPFGHTRGLVQIITKCGQDSYIHMRPFSHELPLESDQFWWEGFDGSRIKVNRTRGYNSPLGHSVEKIQNDIKYQPQEVVSSLWGVGNHGGGPSRVDLTRIRDMIEVAKEEGIEIVHSTPEQFFAEINPTFTFDKSIYLCMPGCYISMSRLKRLHIELENQLYFAEKICTAATMNGLMRYPQAEFDRIMEDLLNAEFHDVLPGTVIKSGEENGIKLLHHGLLDVEKVAARAFFALLKAQSPAKEGDYPVFVFNPNPYEYDTDVECEFTLADQNWEEELVSGISVFDENGSKLTSQVIKEESNLNLDWRKRVIFSAKLKPFSLSRFSIKTDLVKKQEKVLENYCYQDDTKYVEIDKNTGLLKRFCVNGKDYIKDAFLPIMYEDHPDPWAMRIEDLKGLGHNPQPFELCKKPDGVFKGLQNVQIIEDGDIYLGVEALFEKDHSKVIVKYRIYKNRPYVDVEVTAFWQDIDKLLRIAIPVNQSGEYIGQTAFGTDTLFTDGRENVSQRFCAVKNGDDCLAVLNNCVYGSMYENDTIHLSLLRGAAYCSHPINDRPILPENRFVKRIDQCEHTYSFRLAVAKTWELERMAMEFNQKPFVQNVFPVISEFVDGDTSKDIVIDNTDITLVTVKQSIDDEGYILRLFNNSENNAEACVKVGEAKKRLTFGKYEVKTVLYNGTLTEIDMLKI